MTYRKIGVDRSGKKIQIWVLLTSRTSKLWNAVLNLLSISWKCSLVYEFVYEAAELLCCLQFVCSSFDIKEIMQVCEKLFWNRGAQTVKRWVQSYSSNMRLIHVTVRKFIKKERSCTLGFSKAPKWNIKISLCFTGILAVLSLFCSQSGTVTSEWELTQQEMLLE